MRNDFIKPKRLTTILWIALARHLKVTLNLNEKVVVMTIKLQAMIRNIQGRLDQL